MMVEDEKSLRERQIANREAVDALEEGSSHTVAERKTFFKDVYRRAEGDPGMVPWADLAAKAKLHEWLLRHKGDGTLTAVDIACGLGDNAEALADFSGSRAALYARLKLSGLGEAPEQLAVFAETAPEQGHGLGRRSMPETLQYSAVCAVHTLWLAARAAGIGLGWVSILDAGEVSRDLEVPESWRLVAYLCLGYPEEEHDDPELARRGWEQRRAPGPLYVTR